MYLAAVRAETVNPSLASSAWIRRWPHRWFSKAIRRMSDLSSHPIGRRPRSPRGQDRQRQ